MLCKANWGILMKTVIQFYRHASVDTTNVLSSYFMTVGMHRFAWSTVGTYFQSGSKYFKIPGWRSTVHTHAYYLEGTWWELLMTNGSHLKPTSEPSWNLLFWRANQTPCFYFCIYFYPSPGMKKPHLLACYAWFITSASLLRHNINANAKWAYKMCEAKNCCACCHKW